MALTAPLAISGLPRDIFDGFETARRFALEIAAFEFTAMSVALVRTVPDAGWHFAFYNGEDLAGTVVISGDGRRLIEGPAALETSSEARVPQRISSPRCDPITVYTSLASAEALPVSDLDGARSILDRAVACGREGKAEEAIEAFERAAAIYAASGDLPQQAAVLNSLAGMLIGSGRIAEAVTAYHRELAARQQSGDREGQGAALDGLATALRRLGQYETAVNSGQAALRIFRELGSLAHQAAVLGNLGTTWRTAGRYTEALDACLREIAIHRQTGNRRGEAVALDYAGIAFRELGRLDEAITACRQAAEIFAVTGDESDQAVALTNLGVVLRLAHQPTEAVKSELRAFGIYSGAGDDYLERALRSFYRTAAAIGIAILILGTSFALGILLGGGVTGGTGLIGGVLDANANIQATSPHT